MISALSLSSIAYGSLESEIESAIIQSTEVSQNNDLHSDIISNNENGSIDSFA